MKEIAQSIMGHIVEVEDIKYWYRAVEVTEEEYENHPLNSEFKGGLVIEGFCDANDRNVLVLVVRYEGEEPDWQEKYESLLARIGTLEATVLVPSDILAQHLGRRGDLLDDAKRTAASSVIEGLLLSGSIMLQDVAQKETSDVLVTATIEVVRPLNAMALEVKFDG